MNISSNYLRAYQSIHISKKDRNYLNVLMNQKLTPKNLMLSVMKAGREGQINRKSRQLFMDRVYPLYSTYEYTNEA